MFPLISKPLSLEVLLLLHVMISNFREPKRICSIIELFERSGPVHNDVVTPYVYSNWKSISDWRLVQNGIEIWNLILSTASFIPTLLEHSVFLRDNI